MAVTLLSTILGSRARAHRVPPQGDLNLFSLVYYGDKRDFAGGNTTFTPEGTRQVWGWHHFIKKILAFQWEPLEVLFSETSSLIKFHKALLPLWQRRKSLCTLRMVESILDRAEKEMRRSLRSKKRKEGYDPKRAAKAFYMLDICQGIFHRQCFSWGDMEHIIIKINEEGMSRRHVETHWQERLASLRILLVEAVRSPTPTEVRRGEEPKSPIPSDITPDVRTSFLSVAQQVWAEIILEKGSMVSQEELKKELQGQPEDNYKVVTKMVSSSRSSRRQTPFFDNLVTQIQERREPACETDSPGIYLDSGDRGPFYSRVLLSDVSPVQSAENMENLTIPSPGRPGGSISSRVELVREQLDQFAANPVESDYTAEGLMDQADQEAVEGSSE